MRSDLMKKGVDRIAPRALFRALGLTDEELARPIIGIVNAQNEVIPGHMHLDQIAEAVKAGIRMAGGTPLEFPAIGVCDGIAMNHEGMYYSLPSREHIADSVEIMANAHPFDGLVFIPNCDKIVPGMLMAALRLNLPAIFCSGGPMLPGRVNGKQVALTNAFEAPGAVRTGKMTQQEAQEIVEHSCPGCGSCAGMFTANSMNCLTELLGLGLPGNGTIPAVESQRILLAKHAGMRIMDLVREDIRPREIVDQRSIQNALTADTLEELAEKMGVPVDAFVASIEHWNEMCDAGEDSDFHFPGRMMHRIDTAPFYATKEMASCLCTAGGLQITPSSEVLDTSAQPIPGLYAIGNVSGSMFSGTYPHNENCLSHSRCVTFGYNIAKTLAAL